MNPLFGAFDSAALVRLFHVYADAHLARGAFPKGETVRDIMNAREALFLGDMALRVRACHAVVEHEALGPARCSDHPQLAQG